MTVYTIGFTRKTAQQFFDAIKYRMIQLLVDVRLKNNNQMCGFTKKQDLPFFLEAICHCEYDHKDLYAPSKELLTAWKKKRITWQDYEEQYAALMAERNAVEDFKVSYDGLYESVCLLCSEPKPEHCHRRLFAEMVKAVLPETEVIHI